MRILLGFLLLSFSIVNARSRDEDYALVLEEPPLAQSISSRSMLRSAEALQKLERIRAQQDRLRRVLKDRRIRVTGSAQTLVNVVFVRIPRTRRTELYSLPGVSRAAWLPPLRRHLDRAIDLVQTRQGWTAIGGEQNAGTGIKIGIIDTGVDHTHPAFQDASLAIPAGFPKGRPQDLAFTNNKVIVARSYVAQLPFADIDPVDSRPDDTTPRDRVGHGTAIAMIAAGTRNSGPAATIIGVAPKAQLGNYKIFGSPGVNDTTRTPVLIQALEDAFNDGMDIVTLSLGSPAVYGPLDQDPSCSDSGSVPADCDVRARAVENAVSKGLIVVVSAGNDGDIGQRFPTLNSMNTPGTAPSAITVGASTNSHMFFSSVRLTASNAPSNLREINALFGDGPKPATVLTAPLRDVARLQDNGLACGPLGSGSLTGAIALIQRGNCSFLEKVENAQRAGATGVVIYQMEGMTLPIAPSGLSGTAIPAAMIGFSDGTAVKNFLQNNADTPATLDPTLRAVDATFNTVASFSSHGPAIGDSTIKPEVVAVGTDLYTAAQKFDPNGELYDRGGYTAVNGTSFSVPMVAGAAALVKQRNRNLTPGQVKSAVVNTATNDVRDDAGEARVTAVGAGKLNVLGAVSAGVTVEPATLSFGVVGAVPISRTLRITNAGTSAVTLNLAVAARDRDNAASLVVNPNTLNIAPGQQGSVSVQLQGNRPAAGSYEGVVTLSAGGSTLRVPYLYLVGDGIPFNIFPVINGVFDGAVNDTDWLLGFKLVDRFGVPVTNTSVRFRSVEGGGAVTDADAQTDRLGIAAALVNLGPQLGDQIFVGEAGGLTTEFDGFAIQIPAIVSNGVVNAASGQVGRGLAPGSYVSIFGSTLSGSTRATTTTSLPLSLVGVSVSFDAPGLSFPGRLHFVSEGQINVQIPWEFQGLSSVQMKVSRGDVSSALYTVPLSNYAPAAFEIDEPASGRRIAAALDQSFALVTPANAARRGQVIQIYANGLGPVDNPPPSGEPSPAEPLARTRVLPTVTIGGRPASVSFSGLAPFFVGLYQINATVPSDAPAGLQPVVIRIGDVESKVANLPVQ